MLSLNLVRRLLLILVIYKDGKSCFSHSFWDWFSTNEVGEGWGTYMMGIGGDLCCLIG